MQNRELGIYFHIPFCLTKCHYCSFNSYPIGRFSKNILEVYFDSILKEVELYSKILQNSVIKTIYFGGGTPSIIQPEYFKQILSALSQFNLKNSEEITLEANPATLNAEKLESLKKIGIKRLSIGVQSFNNDILKFLGRAHNRYDAVSTIEIAKRFFDNLSIDLIFAVPGQSMDILRQDLSIVKNYKIPHIAIYGLSIEKGSIFYKQHLKELDEKLYSEMFMYISQYLRENNYIHYEISNYCFKGYNSKHNMNYWNYKNYLGFGAGAHSFYNNRRWSNLANVLDYTESLKKYKMPVEYEEIVTKEKMQNEYVFLNLRKKSGINLNNFRLKFGLDFMEIFGEKVEKFKKSGFLEINNGDIFLTEKGFLVSDYIFTEFFV